MLRCVRARLSFVVASTPPRSAHSPQRSHGRTTERPRATGRAAIAACLLAALAVGCKKPQVEIEEEAPPPLSPTELDRLNQGAQPSSGGPGGGPQAASPGQGDGPLDAPALDNAGACALVDAHLKGLGLEIEGRQCYGLRPEGAGFRIPSYDLPVTPAPAQTWEPRPVCLWERDPSAPAPVAALDGPGLIATPAGYEIGYFDMGAPCRSRDEYCRLGAPGVRLELSTTGCPGDDALGPPPDALPLLVGEWIAASEREGPSKLSVGPDGRINYEDGAWRFAGALRFVRPGAAIVETDNGGIPIGFLLAPKSRRLFLGPGAAAPTVAPDAFIAEIAPGLWVRRYNESCYDVTPGALDAPALTEPRRLPCVRTESSVETAVVIDLGDRKVTLVRTPWGWVSSMVGGSVWRRAEAPPP